MNSKTLDDFEYITINSKEEFLSFMQALITSYYKERETWENRTLEDYLRAIESWVEDLEGFYLNGKKPVPDPNWDFLATVLCAATSYE